MDDIEIKYPEFRIISKKAFKAAQKIKRARVGL